MYMNINQEITQNINYSMSSLSNAPYWLESNIQQIMSIDITILSNVPHGIWSTMMKVKYAQQNDII